MNPHQHLYDTARWRNGRKQFLADHPLCVLCRAAGRVSAASVVDHIEAHRGDPEKFFDSRNWQGLCKPCHDGAKQSLEKRGGGPIRGCDVGGMPLDPAHPWNRERGKGG